MRNRAKSPREGLADLARTYGSFAAMGRSFANRLGVKPKTAARYLSQMEKGARSIPKTVIKGVRQRIYYQQVTKPRAQIARISGIDNKIDFASTTERKTIDLKELLPPGTSFFGFEFQNEINSNPKFKFVREAIERGLRIKISAISESDDGRFASTGTIGGTDDVKDPRSKKKSKTTKRYLSEFYHIIRRAYNATGAISWIISETDDAGDLIIGE